MFCNYCGASNVDDAAFCNACGKRIIRVPAPQVPTPPEVAASAPSEATPSAAAPARGSSRGAGGFMLALGVLMVLGAVIAIGVALEVSRPKDDPSLFAPSSPPVAVSATSGASDMASQAPPPAASPPPATTSEPRPAYTADAPPVAAPAPEPPPVAPAAAPAPPPAAPTIVGEWVTDVPIGISSLTLTSDGHCRIKNIFTDEDGIYTYSIDGTLRIQKDSIWSHVVVTWQAQLSPDGESLTVIEPEGAAHVYKRVH